MKFRAGNIVKVVKAVSRKDETKSRWHQDWYPTLDFLLTAGPLHIWQIDWYQRSDGFCEGMGIMVGSPTNWKNGYWLHPDSLVISDECIPFRPNDKGVMIERISFTGGLNFKTRNSEMKLDWNQFCCGTVSIGAFSFYSEEEGKLLINEALTLAKKERKGVIHCTTVGRQYTANDCLRACGFEVIHEFENPNSGNIVSEWSNRTFHGKVTR